MKEKTLKSKNVFSGKLLHLYVDEVELEDGHKAIREVIRHCEASAILAIDEEGRKWAYIRIADENILATPIHLRIWQQNGNPDGELTTFTEREQSLLKLLEEHDNLSLNRYCRLAHLPRRAAEHLLAKLVRYGIIELVFEGHKFYFRLKR